MWSLGKWILLSAAGLVCLTVWSIVIWTFAFRDEVEYARVEAPESIILSEEVVVSTIPPSESMIEEEEEKLQNINSFEHGLTKADAIKIAPSGVISIDDLLLFVKNDQH